MHSEDSQNGILLAEAVSTQAQHSSEETIDLGESIYGDNRGDMDHRKGSPCYLQKLGT